MSTIPTKARAVIIGGGVSSGCSFAYHLAKLGWTTSCCLSASN